MTNEVVCGGRLGSSNWINTMAAWLSPCQLIDEPDYHKAIAPMGHQRGASERFFATALRICAAEQSFGFAIDDFNAPAVPESSDRLLVNTAGAWRSHVKVRSYHFALKQVTLSSRQGTSSAMNGGPDFASEEPCRLHFSESETV